MQKSAKSIMANSDCFTELTDAEMEATTGGVVYGSRQLTNFLDGYLAGNYTEAYLRTQFERVRPAEKRQQKRVALRWFNNLPSSKKLQVIRIADTFGIDL